MKRTGVQKLIGLVPALGLALAFAQTAWAGHGPLSSTTRDGWINWQVGDLVAAGLAQDPQKPINQMTNLEVAELTFDATRRYMAQADVNMLPPPLPADNTPAASSANDGPGLPGALSGEASSPNQSLQDLVQAPAGN